MSELEIHERKLEGINLDIFNSLKNNQKTWECFSLGPLDHRLAEFFSEPQPDRAIPIIRNILQKHGKDRLAEYAVRLAEIEIGVQKFNPRLRDHVNHSVYVFFLGLFLKNNIGQIKVKPLSWKLAALLHDISYPIELFSRSIGEYLESVHSLKTEITQNVTPTQSKMPAHSILLKDFESLVSGKNAFELINTRLADWNLKLDLKSVYNRKMEGGIVDHGILSALVVLNVIDAWYFKYNPNALEESVIHDNLDWSRKYFHYDILDAASAIAVHNLTLDELKTEICFEKAPLLFVLLFCDSLQIWNRNSPELQVYGPTSIKLGFKENQILCGIDLSGEDFDKVRKDVERLGSKRFNIILQQK